MEIQKAKETLPGSRDCIELTSSNRHDDGTRTAVSGIQYADSAGRERVCVMP